MPGGKGRPDTKKTENDERILIIKHRSFYRNSLDADCKKWRLFADIINDSAMFLELTVPYFPDFSLHVLCLTTTMKAIVCFTFFAITMCFQVFFRLELLEVPREHQ